MNVKKRSFLNFPLGKNKIIFGLIIVLIFGSMFLVNAKDLNKEFRKNLRKALLDELKKPLETKHFDLNETKDLIEFYLAGYDLNSDINWDEIPGKQNSKQSIRSLVARLFTVYNATECLTGWKCKTSSEKAYQNADCSWSSISFCERGCSDGECGSGGCADIVSDSERDQCYMQRAVNGDSSVCPRIVNVYLKQNCYALFNKTCTDSDGGKDYYVKGAVSKVSFEFEDRCEPDGLLKEYFCQSTREEGFERYNCPNGCQDGACIGEIVFNLVWDIDDNKVVEQNDGNLTLKYLFGFRGDTLIQGNVGQNAQRTTASEIEAYLSCLENLNILDVDGNGNNDALTDGLLVQRYIAGYSGQQLIYGVIGTNATRTTAEEVIAFLKNPGGWYEGACIELKTCSEQQGYICLETEYCPGNELEALDTDRCCNQPCRIASWSACSECGTGLFNVCDEDECNAISEGCYYEGLLTCTSCSEIRCNNYDNEKDCYIDKCDKNCKWDGSSCVEAVGQCGNNIKETGEFCDGTDLARETCQSQGFDSGTLGCLANCSGFDTMNCVVNPTCDSCGGCDTIFTDCSYQECKQDCDPGTGCYYKGAVLLVDDCVDLGSACRDLISSCGDYSAEECNSNPCELKPGCSLNGGSCVEKIVQLCSDAACMTIDGVNECKDAWVAGQVSTLEILSCIETCSATDGCIPPELCGDAICNGDENCSSCPNDCRDCCVPSPEICDGLDNNCDGVTDEGCDQDVTGDWPMFRGNPAHTGYSKSNAPDTNNLLWRLPIEGTKSGMASQSSPVVKDGVIYIGRAGGVTTGVIAINATSQGIIWSYVTGGASASVYSTPAVAYGRVYFGSGDYSVYSLNALTGELIWKYTADLFIIGSSTVYDGKVYIASFDGSLYALNATTNNPNGELIWKTKIAQAPHSTPGIKDNVACVGSGTPGTALANMSCLNALTGEILWYFEAPGGIYSSPAINDGIVYFNSDTGYAYAFDVTNGDLIWSYNIGPNAASPSVAFGRVFTLNDMSIARTQYGDRFVYSFDAANGTLLWRYNITKISSLDGKSNNPSSSPSVSADGKVCLGVDGIGTYWTGGYQNGSIICLNALTNNQDGELIWEYEVGAGVYVDTSPAIVDGVMYIAAGDGYLYAFGSK